MRRLASITGIAAIAVAFTLSAALGATANRTWVKSDGLATNTTASPPCNPLAPCDTFFTALSATNPGGEINCVDSGNYGGATITISLFQ